MEIYQRTQKPVKIYHIFYRLLEDLPTNIKILSDDQRVEDSALIHIERDEQVQSGEEEFK